MKIIGAGLAGLLAGNIFQRVALIEAGSREQSNHKAVLRFRSAAVGEAVGIDFRPVTVHKGVWYQNKFTSPNIQLANFYSQKVINKVMDRSVWNLDPVQRFIAPRDLVAQLAERCGSRIAWDTRATIDDLQSSDGVISTAPMPVLQRLLHGREPDMEFNFAPIVVKRWLVPRADAFQTIYFPDPAHNLYRASITSDLLIAEFVDSITEGLEEELFTAFGLLHTPTPLDLSKQRYGKIAPVDDGWRRSFILNATLQHNVYSLGRFATWRNILLDDVLHDIAVIKRLISGGAYAAARWV